MTHKTVGAHSLELLQKTPESRDPIEIERAMQEDYMKELLQCIDTHHNHFEENIFYVEVLTKAEKLMPNVFRNYFVPRSTCPTPYNDQSVYSYNKALGKLNYMWTVPDREVCYHLIQHASEVVDSEKQLLQFCILYANGSLLELCKKINKEEAASNIIMK